MSETRITAIETGDADDADPKPGRRGFTRIGVGNADHGNRNRGRGSQTEETRIARIETPGRGWARIPKPGRRGSRGLSRNRGSRRPKQRDADERGFQTGETRIETARTRMDADLQTGKTRITPIGVGHADHGIETEGRG